MQYLLSEEEYLSLKNAEAKAKEKVKNDLQTLCTMVCDNTPITRYWEDPKEEKRPWRCILSTNHRGHYCDECPVKKLCPCEHKEWSK